jgi:hypothetical protein
MPAHWRLPVDGTSYCVGTLRTRRSQPIGGGRGFAAPAADNVRAWRTSSQLRPASPGFFGRSQMG